MKIAIFDYGAGNIFSLKNALEKEGAEVEVIEDMEEPNKYSGIVFPGVGNFDPAIKRIRGYDTKDIREYIGNTPVLGICLGMEMFFEKSDEGKEQGFGIMEGDVLVLPKTMKVPHMGWNNLEITQKGRLLEDIPDDSWVYFVHSYRVQPKNQEIIMAESDYGIRVPAVVEKENYFGTQFHPEKSGDVGSIILKNFLRECKK